MNVDNGFNKICWLARNIHILYCKQILAKKFTNNIELQPVIYKFKKIFLWCFFYNNKFLCDWHSTISLTSFPIVIIIIYKAMPQKTKPLCLTVGLSFLCSAHRETVLTWPTCDWLQEEINTSPSQSGGNQSSCSAGSQIKVAILCPNNLSLNLLDCGEQYQLGLSNNFSL